MRDRKAVDAALKGCDRVVHLAAAVGVGQSMYEVERYTDVNNRGTAVLMEALIERPVESLVVASSMSVYGEGSFVDREGDPVRASPRPVAQLKRHEWEVLGPGGVPLTPVPTTEAEPPEATSVYALSKFDQERLGVILGAAYDIPTVALRFFNVYGPRQALSNPYTGVLAIFASRLLSGRPPVIFEDGEQRRDFVSVHDVAAACELASDEAPRHPGAVLNVGSGRSVTVNEIAAALAETPREGGPRPGGFAPLPRRRHPALLRGHLRREGHPRLRPRRRVRRRAGRTGGLAEGPDRRGPRGPRPLPARKSRAGRLTTAARPVARPFDREPPRWFPHNSRTSVETVSDPTNAAPGAGTESETGKRSGGPVLITGGAGFVGCNLADALLRDGARVRAFDNLSRPGVERNLRWLEHEHRGAVEFVEADVRDAAAVRAAVRGCSRAYHFAAQVAVTTSLTGPVADFETNARGTLNVLEAVRSEAGAGNRVPLLFTSTNKVYGDLGGVETVPRDGRHEPADAELAARGVGKTGRWTFTARTGAARGRRTSTCSTTPAATGCRRVCFG